jgi:hypothetical protein
MAHMPTLHLDKKSPLLDCASILVLVRIQFTTPAYPSQWAVPPAEPSFEDIALPSSVIFGSFGYGAGVPMNLSGLTW